MGQKAKSKAIYANVGFQATETLRMSGGLRYTKDDKNAYVNINNGLIEESNSQDWSDTSWELAAVWEMNDRMNVYGTIQNGYQSGQFPARPLKVLILSISSLTKPPWVWSGKAHGQ